MQKKQNKKTGKIFKTSYSNTPQRSNWRNKILSTSGGHMLTDIAHLGSCRDLAESLMGGERGG